jgi:hypothetical protein
MRTDDQDNRCRHVRLAEQEMCQVDFCARCNCLVVTIGGVTLRLHPTVFRSAAAALTTAQARLDGNPRCAQPSRRWN